MESLLQLDREVLLAINSMAGSSNLLDGIMLGLSNKWIWIPLYALILFALLKEYGLAKVGWICLAAVSMLIITDQGSVHLFKEVFHRLRPCHVPELRSLLSLPSGSCGGQYGFVSSHAANVFGVAIFSKSLIHRSGSWSYGLIVWAALVGFSRIYLGVHYPIDVLVGSVLGGAIGYLASEIVKRIIHRR